ncbi:hypothetical protein HER39_19965, partial [Arthrobacter deserti]|nr:hypothetical protein [Arthrobacter deserti]
MPNANRTTRAMIAAAAAVALTAAAAPAVAAEDADTIVSGRLSDSTAYRFIVPADWNGTVFV